ncbi:MAG TPA: AarF/UbiB family protein [Gemmatimonadaceae bacterium]|nr:AarF/UbiB family protein [Gemmatimonadaceae bacterium]
MRTLLIVYRLLPFALSFVRDHRRWLVAGGPVPRSPEFHARRAARLADTVARLGPTFVKLAQVFASRADLIPEPYLAGLGRLVDQVPAVPYEAVRRQIVESYGVGPEALWDDFDESPIAAASLGQVHRARYRGREIVVKVLRPGVHALVDADVAAANRILRVVARRWPTRQVRAVQTVVAEFAARTREELDFRQEAAFATEVRANVARRTDVIVPEVVDEFTRERVLVLQYIEGRRIDRLEEWIAEGRIVPRRLVQTVMELYLQMMLVDGLFHADPHPGNLLVTQDGRVVVLDFGMVVRVPRQLRVDLVQTVFATIRRDVDAAVEGFARLGVLEEDADRQQIADVVRMLLALSDLELTTTQRIEHVLLSDNVMRQLYDAPVVLPSHLVYFARTASLIEGLGTRYDPYFNPITFASPVVLRLRGRIMASLRDEHAPPEDWAASLGALVGDVAVVMQRAGREIASIFGERVFGLPPRGARRATTAA